MKKFTLVFTLVFFTLSIGLTWGQQSQKNSRNNESIKVDTRIDNMGYWNRCVELGLVPVAPNIPPAKATFSGSEINSRLVREDESVDVPVTEENSTQSENSIFVNPNDYDNALNSNNSTQNPVGSLYGTSGFFTFNTGVSWDGSVEGTGGTNQGDPAACIGSNGMYFVGAIRENGQAVAHSFDLGETWTMVQVAPGPPGFNSLLDKNHLWIDNSLTSLYNGNLYNAWTYFGNGADDSEIQISVSSDNGLSWSSAVNISSNINAGSHNQGVNIQTGPYGEVYVLWTVYDNWPADENAMGFTQSLDGGNSWSPATRIISNIRGIRNTTTGKNQRMNSFPSMAVDISEGVRRGTIYAVWPNIGVPGTNEGPDADIYMIKSINAGATWSEPTRVNQDEPGNGYKHYFSWITCDPISGVLSVVFYDDRDVGGNQVEVFCSNSTDGGETWEDFKVSDVAFTPSPIPGLAGGYFGDYLGISAKGGHVYPCWTDNRTGTAMTYVSPYILGIPPNPAENPIPSDGEENLLPFLTFSWKDGPGDGDSASSYKIFLGSAYPPTNVINGDDVDDPVFTLPGSLDHNTLYYWRIDSYNIFGSTEGNIWSFSTTSPPNEDFETGDFTHNNWFFGGDEDWEISDEYARSGIYSTRSGSIDVGETSSLKLNLEVVFFGNMKFSKKTSTRQGSNTLQFLVDDNLMAEWSGEEDWTEESFLVFAGEHTFEWRYAKTATAGTEEDAVWIDYIGFPPFPELTVDAGPDGPSCEGEPYELQGNATYYTSIIWTTTGDGIFDDPELLNANYTSGPGDAELGSIELTLSANNAEGDSVSDSMMLNVFFAPKPFAGTPAEICVGQDYTLSEATAEHYFSAWWTTSGDGIFNDTLLLNPLYTPGIEDVNMGYVVLTLHAKGNSLCEVKTSDMELLILDTPVTPQMPEGPDWVDLYYTTTTEYTIEKLPFANIYEWDLIPVDAGNITGTDSIGFVEWNQQYLGNAFIKVKAINICGESEFSEELPVTVGNTVSVNNTNDQDITVIIIPNPNNGRFKIEILADTRFNGDLKIINSSGGVIYHENNLRIDLNYSKEIDLGKPNEGVYYLYLNYGNHQIIKKLITIR